MSGTSEKELDQSPSSFSLPAAAAAADLAEVQEEKEEGLEMAVPHSGKAPFPALKMSSDNFQSLSFQPPASLTSHNISRPDLTLSIAGQSPQLGDKGAVLGSAGPAPRSVPEDPTSSHQQRSQRYVTDRDGKRVSFSSLYSLGSSVYSAPGDKLPSTAVSSVAGSIKGSMEDPARQGAATAPSASNGTSPVPGRGGDSTVAAASTSPSSGWFSFKFLFLITFYSSCILLPN